MQNISTLLEKVRQIVRKDELKHESELAKNKVKAFDKWLLLGFKDCASSYYRKAGNNTAQDKINLVLKNLKDLKKFDPSKVTLSGDDSEIQRSGYVGNILGVVAASLLRNLVGIDSSLVEKNKHEIDKILVELHRWVEPFLGDYYIRDIGHHFEEILKDNRDDISVRNKDYCNHFIKKFFGIDGWFS